MRGIMGDDSTVRLKFVAGVVIGLSSFGFGNKVDENWGGCAGCVGCAGCADRYWNYHRHRKGQFSVFKPKLRVHEASRLYLSKS